MGDTSELALQLVLWLEFVKLELNRVSPKSKSKFWGLVGLWFMVCLGGFFGVWVFVGFFAGHLSM